MKNYLGEQVHVFCKTSDFLIKSDRTMHQIFLTDDPDDAFLKKIRNRHTKQELIFHRKRVLLFWILHPERPRVKIEINCWLTMPNEPYWQGEPYFTFLLSPSPIDGCGEGA